MGYASSLAATTPALFKDARSHGVSPSIPFVRAPIGATKIPPDCGDDARSIIKSIRAGLSHAGFVQGMQQMIVNPPGAADCIPVRIVSVYENPGSRKCTWICSKPGVNHIPLQS